MKGEQVERRLLRNRMGTSDTSIGPRLAGRGDCISTYPPYRVISVKKRGRDHMVVPVCAKRMTVGLAHDAPVEPRKVAKYRVGKGRHAFGRHPGEKHKHKHEHSVVGALESVSNELGVPADTSLRCRRRRSSHERKTWLRMKNPNCHKSKRKKTVPTRDGQTGKLRTEGEEDSTRLSSGLHSSRPEQRITRMRTGASAGRDEAKTYAKSTLSGSSDGADVTSACQDGSSSASGFERSVPARRTRAESKNGCVLSASEMEKNGGDCWRPRESGHNRVIKRRKLSLKELHMACMNRSSTSRVGGSDKMKFVDSSTQIERATVGQRDLDGFGERSMSHTVIPAMRRNTALGQEELDIGNCAHGAYISGNRIKGMQENGYHSDKRMGSDGGGGMIRGDDDINFIDGEYESKGLDAAETFKVNTAGMRWHPDGYRNEEGRIASFTRLSDVVDQVLEGNHQTSIIQHGSIQSLIPEDQPAQVFHRSAQDKNAGQGLYTSPNESTRSSWDTCAPHDPTCGNGLYSTSVQYTRGHVLVDMDRDGTSAKEKPYLEVSDSKMEGDLRGKYSSCKWHTLRGIADNPHTGGNCSQRHIFASTDNGCQSAEWVDYGAQDRQHTQDGVQVVLSRGGHLGYANGKKQAMLKRQLAEMLKTQEPIFLSGMGVSGHVNPTPMPMVMPSPTASGTVTNPYSRVGASPGIQRDVMLQQGSSPTLASGPQRFHGGKRNAGGLNSLASQPVYVRLTNHQGLVNGGVGQNFPIMLVNKQSTAGEVMRVVEGNVDVRLG